MLTKEQVANLKKGDTIVYNNNGRKSEWTVDYPKQLINPKQKITVFEGSHPNPKRVALETPAGGGECTNREKGCVRVSMLTPTGRGHQRFSMLVSDFDNWELPEGAQNGNANDTNTENPSNPQGGETPPAEGTEGNGNTGSTGSEPVTPSEVSLTSLSPNPNEENVALGTPIVLTFNNNVKAGSGKIGLIYSGGEVEYPVTGSDIEFNGNTVTLQTEGKLSLGTEYTVQIDASAILDSNDNPLNVLAGNVYKFTTVAMGD